MIGHEIFGLLGTIVAATAVLAALRGGTTTKAVMDSGFSGFANLLSTMQGNAPAAASSQTGA